MKFIKFITACVITSSLVSFSANAEDQGQGVINFKGKVINAPCGIDPESADQSIDFGQTSKAHLESNGISVKKDLNIKLVNCNAAELSKSGSVKVSFSGTTIKGQVKELGTVGDTGTAIVISDASGGFIPFDGTVAESATKLKEGNNTLRYGSWVKKATGGILKEGEFSAITNFNLVYE